VIAVLLSTGLPITASNQPAGYLAGALLLGILTSWVAAAAWNRAATALPVALAGQLVVIETVAGTAYSYLYHHSWPETAFLAGLALLVAGVTLAVRRTNPQPQETNAPSPAASTHD
jgi:drug/metabolite transporter (DMT)-like permease